MSIYDDSDEIWEILMSHARRGNATALKIVADRTIPPLKSVIKPLEDPEPMTLEESIHAQARVVWQRMAAGRLRLEVGEVMLKTLAYQLTPIGMAELESRLKVLEKPDAD